MGIGGSDTQREGEMMKKRHLKRFVICGLAAALLSGCQSERDVQGTAAQQSSAAPQPWSEESGMVSGNPDEAPSLTPKEYPVVDGSTATIPLSTALYQRVTGATEEEAESAVCHTKTTNAYNRLLNGEAELVLAYEPSASVYENMEQSGVKMNIKPIGKDALVFLSNVGNPVKSLSRQQLVEIYSGRMKSWSEAGGEQKEILAFQRPENSGSQTLMQKLVMQKTPMEEAPVTSIVGEMGELLERVAAYGNQRNALGYSVYFYARNMYEIPGLRLMEVDGIQPSSDTIRDGSYPYVNEFYASIREDEPEDSPAHLLFDWLTTDKGQRFVGSLGYVSLIQTDGAEGEGGAAERSQTVVLGEDSGLSASQRLVLDGESIYGISGVMVLNREMNIVHTIEDARLTSFIELADTKQPVILQETGSGLKGLYDLAEERWLLKPRFSALYKTEDGVIQGYEASTNTSFRITFTDQPGKEGPKLKTVIQEEPAEQRLGSHIWEVDDEGLTAVIKDLDGAVQKELKFSDYLDCQYAYLQEPYFVAWGSDQSFVLFDEAGELVFTLEDLGSEWPGQSKDRIYLGALSHDGKWIEICSRDGHRNFVYNLEQKRVMTHPGVSISAYISETVNVYSVADGNKTVIYNSDGELLRAKTGQDFTFVLGGGYYAYQDGKQVYVEGGSPVKTYRLPFENLQDGYYIAKDTFLLSGTDSYKVYQNENCLLEDPAVSWWLEGDSTIVSSGGNDNLIFQTESGRILYRSKVPEILVRSLGELQLVARGNYLCLMNGQGQCLLKVLEGEMASD